MEQIDRLELLIPEESNSDLLELYLELAAKKILARAYPYNATIDEVPNEYLALQLEIAVYLYNKRGAEGQKSHNEGGINRSYESADVPESMMQAITPRVGVV